MRIAFFDSGIGGISVLSEALQRLPNEDFIYLADTLHVPYGTKSKEQVKQYVKQCVDILMEENIKALVVACNTATSIAVSDLREKYEIPIIGMEPAVKPAVEMNQINGKRVLVFATDLTLKQSKYADLISRIDDRGIVDSLPLPELVQFCEQLNFNGNEISAYFNQKLSEFDLSQYGTVVLGCTHYPFYRSILRDILPSHIQIVDGGKGTINRLSQILKDHNLLSTQGNANVKFLCTNNDQAYVNKMMKALELLKESYNEG
jgi:glutamate racemase